MFKKLQSKVAEKVTNKEAFKFAFNLSVDHLSDFKDKKKIEENATFAVGHPIFHFRNHHHNRFLGREERRERAKLSL